MATEKTPLSSLFILAIIILIATTYACTYPKQELDKEIKVFRATTIKDAMELMQKESYKIIAITYAENLSLSKKAINTLSKSTKKIDTLWIIQRPFRLKQVISGLNQCEMHSSEMDGDFSYYGSPGTTLCAGKNIVNVNATAYDWGELYILENLTRN